ncbi:uncharacterized protein LOC107268814 [Cephus cinctus]|uniref:Uncharacterized protein LOC107268814 n=1 Tax=Cephus cinctus TaxID=211228 RepID=A0AAJ7BZ10_CEPCN|nr:uncharacterized protein LOC107268814 [Cephus cinctus]
MFREIYRSRRRRSKEKDEGEVSEGLFPYESLKMIDSGRLNSSLATALRDRSTCIPVQPNRSLPLRPVPPMPIPTRNAMVKLPKDSPILMLAHMIPPKSNDRVNGSEGEPNVICSSRDQSAEKQHLFEFQNESDSDVIITDNFSDGLDGQVKRKIGNLEGELFKINRKKEKESLEHRNIGENVIKGNRSDNRNSNDANDSLIVNYSNNEKIPPLKLRKVLQGNTEKADRLAKEKKAEEMTNYRIVSGRTPAPTSPFTDITFPGLEIDFSSATLHILEGNVSQVDLTVVSQSSTNVEDKSGDCGKLNLAFRADESSLSRVQTNATVENSIEDEILSAITQERNNNRELISMQKQQKHYDVAQVIPKCPASVPISVAKRHKISAKATVMRKPLDSKMPITKSHEENACNLPSMPLLEFDFEEHKEKVKVQSATRKTNDREIVSDDFSVKDNIRASRNESLLPEGDSKESNDAGPSVYVEDLLLDSISLESRSTLSVSPRTQEGVNELERLNEQGKQEPGDENSERVIKDKCRRFEENKMQELLQQQLEAAARYQKRTGPKRTYVREEATEHRETMSSDESCCMEQDEEQEHEQLYDFKNSSTNSASIVRRSVEEQLQYRRTKLRIMLQELKMQTGLLKKQMESVPPDGFQRGRVQQMINCTEKQAENLTKQLNKLSGEMDTKNKEENKVQCIPQKDPPSPEPPKLSPTLPFNYSRGSSSHLRNSPPVLPRAGPSLVSEIYDSASKSTTRQSPSTSACPSLDAKRISEPLRRDTVVPSCLANTRKDGPLSDTERLRALNTLMTLVESIPNYAKNPQQAASESHFSSQRSVAVGETRALTGKSIGNMHGEQSAALRYPGNVTSLQTSCNLPGSCIQIENPGGANVYRKANGLVEANSAQANSVPSGSFARTSATFDNTAQPIEYGRPADAGNMQINNNVTTILPAKSNFNGNGTFYQNFGPQDCSVLARTALPQQIPSKITQASAAVGPTIRSASHRSRASVPGKPTGQSYRAQQLNTKMDTGKLRSTKRSKSDTSQKDSSQRTNRQIMSENFPTLGNWIAQMSQQQIPTKSAVKTPSSIPTKLSSDVIAPAITTLEDPSNFRVPGSDMYKMTATAVDMPMSIKLNNINGHWKNNRWEENSIALQQEFRPTGAAQLYQNNFIGYPYGTTFGYHPLYGYRTFTYPHLHPGSMNPHQVMVDSLNSRLGQNTEGLANLQGTEQFTTEMMKHQILAAAFPNQNINSEYVQPTTIGQSIGPNRTVLHASTQNEQFRIPNAPAMQQPNENSYWLAGQSSLSRFSNNEINQLNNCMAASQMKRNYEAVLLENRNSQLHQTGNTSDPNFSSTKEQSVAIDTSMFSKSLLMNLTKEVMGMERNCGTPHLAKVTHNPSILSTLKCANCGSTGSMFKCLGCELTFYCNESCQEQHWLLHGQKCPKKMPKLKKLT